MSLQRNLVGGKEFHFWQMTSFGLPWRWQEGSVEWINMWILVHLVQQCYGDKINVHKTRKIVDKIRTCNSSRKVSNQRFVFLVVNTWVAVTVPHLKVKVEIDLRHRGRKANIFLCTFLDPMGFSHNSSLGIISFLIGGTNLYVQEQCLKKSLGQWIFQKEHGEHFREKGISAENTFWRSLWHFKSFPGLFFAYGRSLYWQHACITILKERWNFPYCKGGEVLIAVQEMH